MPCSEPWTQPELLDPNPEAPAWPTSPGTEIPGGTSVLPHSQVAMNPQLPAAQLAASHT